MAKAPPVKRFAWIASAAAGVAALLISGVFAPGMTTRLETMLYDRALRSSNAMPFKDVAIVTIDESSTKHLGAWPWAHSVHAQLIDKLNDMGATVIAFTMPFGESPSHTNIEQLRAAINLLQANDLSKSAQGEQLKKMLDNSVANLDQDAGLAKAIAKHGNVVLPIEVRLSKSDDKSSPTPRTNSTIDVAADNVFMSADAELVADAIQAYEVHLPATPLANQARALGHTALSTEFDQVLRSDLGAVRFDDQVMPSLGLAIVARMRGLNISQVQLDDEGLVSLGQQRLQLDSHLRWRPMLHPPIGERAISQFTYWQILSGDIDATQLRGKAVLIGITDTSGTQGLAVPAIAIPLGMQLAPVQALASMVSSLHLNRNYRHPDWATPLEWLVSIVIVMCAAMLFPTLSMITTTIAGVLLSSALIFIEIGLLNLTGTWLQLMLPVLTLMGAMLGAIGLTMARQLGSPHGKAGDGIESLRMLGLTFQGQGQLELAYETFRRCPGDQQTMDLLYGLGQDYERRRQFNKATEVYAYLASLDTSYKDVVQRRDRMKRADIVQGGPPRSTAKSISRVATSNDYPPTIPVPVSHQINRKQTLGRYEIERELGKGAMGVVYLGRDPKINRVVAIKAIALADEFDEDDLVDARERFFREAEMAGRLNHPGIVTVYDAGEDRGLAYIAMEYLRGEHLSHYAEAIYLLPPVRVFSLIARVAEALDYAHKQNVVHRDIKPANIMFNKDTDELKITDFGIARLTDTSRTKTGIVLGTPSFMSPEQLEGRPLDGRSDLFALGIALYQLLTGQLPFRADSMTRLMQKIATEAHVPLRSLRPELPEMAEQIMTQVLAKNAADRYQTGSEIAVALRTCTRLMGRKEAVAR